MSKSYTLSLLLPILGFSFIISGNYYLDFPITCGNPVVNVTVGIAVYEFSLFFFVIQILVIIYR